MYCECNVNEVTSKERIKFGICWNTEPPWNKGLCQVSAEVTSPSMEG